MSEESIGISLKLETDILQAAEVVRHDHPKQKRHAILVAAVREGLRVFLTDPDRFAKAHAKEALPLPPQNAESTK